jgi:chemotaxis family two-component system sensor kinase Cph1
VGVTTPDQELLDARRASDAERFATTVTHELGSSLLVVSKLAETLHGDPELSFEQARHVAQIVRMTDRMRHMVASARYLFTSPEDLDTEEVALVEVLHDALEALAPLIDERRPELVVSEPLPIVFGVHIHLVQLFENLLSNAIKYGPARHGRVELTVTELESGWRIAVRDHGAGIAPEYQESIFEPFRRLRGTGHVPGTGLGLTICRQIAENHGGTLTLESTPGAGTTFVFELPDRAAMVCDRAAARYAFER